MSKLEQILTDHHLNDLNENLYASLFGAISDLLREAHRNGQLDCQQNGIVTNHKHFPEATREARIEELEKLMPFAGFKVGGVWREIEERLAELREEGE